MNLPEGSIAGSAFGRRINGFPVYDIDGHACPSGLVSLNLLVPLLRLQTERQKLWSSRAVVVAAGAVAYLFATPIVKYAFQLSGPFLTTLLVASLAYLVSTQWGSWAGRRMAGRGT